MALIDSENHLYIGEEAGKRLGYLPGKALFFVMVNDKKYRMEVAIEKTNGEDLLVCEESLIDERFRFIVPKTLRKMFTREAVILEKDGSLYVQFLRLKSDDEWVKKQLLERETDDRK